MRISVPYCMMVGGVVQQLPIVSASQDEMDEEASSLFMTLTLALVVAAIFLTYFLLNRKLTYMPESVATILLGIAAGAIISQVAPTKFNFLFNPEFFLLFLLPPILFESGYSLHKGNFFTNIGSITVFAVGGTIIATLVTAGIVYTAGRLELISALTPLDTFIWGSLISAVDPVATLAIFHALDVDHVLYMLVFGESVLNDAVSITLYRTFIGFVNRPFSFVTVFHAVGQFFFISIVSVVIGIVGALITSLIFKNTRLNDYPSLEISLLVIFAFLPYLIAEGWGMSGILAVLFNGICMAHYNHFNLSPLSQITSQQLFRMISFVAETFVFTYLGLNVFFFPHDFQLQLIILAIVAILIARGINVFGLSVILNRYRTHKLSKRTQFIMWFSGLRGAIAFALALNIPSDANKVLTTTTLVVVLFTVLCLGGGTLPMMRLFDLATSTEEVNMSKTAELGQPVGSDEAKENIETPQPRTPSGVASWFERLDAQILIPFFRADRPLTQQVIELHGKGHFHVQYHSIRPAETEAGDDVEDDGDESAVISLPGSLSTVDPQQDTT